MYVIIACPKCKSSVQIIDDIRAKNTKCQKCGAILPRKRLKKLYETADLNKAIEARGRIQFEMDTNSEISPNILKKYLIDSRPGYSKKKDIKSIIIQVIDKNGGTMIISNLKNELKKYDFSENQVESTLDRMLEVGEIYCPRVGWVGLI